MDDGAHSGSTIGLGWLDWRGERELRRANAILETASAFFAAEGRHVLAKDQVAFPMTWHRPVLYLCCSLRDVREPGPATAAVGKPDCARLGTRSSPPTPSARPPDRSRCGPPLVATSRLIVDGARPAGLRSQAAPSQPPDPAISPRSCAQSEDAAPGVVGPSGSRRTATCTCAVLVEIRNCRAVGLAACPARRRTAPRFHPSPPATTSRNSEPAQPPRVKEGLR